MKELIADSLMLDPRLAQAKRLALEALEAHRGRIQAVRPPDPQLRETYAQTVAHFSELRGGALYYPYLGSGIGNGPLVELADGSIKYDMISGIGVNYFGHGHPRLVSATLDAALRDTVMQGNLQQDVRSVAVAQRLIDLATRHGAPLNHCFLSTSGAMANENALKLVLQKKHPSDRVLAFEHAFAGRTLALAQITDKPEYRQGLPQTLAVDYVPFFDPLDGPGSTRRAVATLESHLRRYPGQHAVMCMELVQGEGGFYPGDRAFFAALIEILKAHGVATWFDEVQTFGRTSEPFAFQTFGLDADAHIVTVGKLTQVCATLFSDEYKPKPGLISQTFTASTSAFFAADVVLSELADGGYFGPDGRVEKVRRQIVSRLEAIASRHPDRLRGPFGIGVMIAFSVFDGSAAKTKTFLHALFDAGVIAFVAGDHPSRARFLPPVGAMRESDVEQVCLILEKTLEAFDAA